MAGKSVREQQREARLARAVVASHAPSPLARAGSEPLADALDTGLGEFSGHVAGEGGRVVEVTLQVGGTEEPAPDCE